ncbi:MAG: transcription-repair coupling factor [Alphaproteobacteria bacterium]|nr:transcription-repair coupling factor [Alphaproteobacteria bacterium]
MTEIKKQVLGGVVDGFDAFVLLRYAQQDGTILYICETETQLNKTEQILKTIAPQITVLNFPAWDTIPYDRVSPNSQIESERLDTLSSLSNLDKSSPLIILTTVPAVLQKVPPVEFFKNKSLSFKVGDFFDVEKFTTFLNQNGYIRTQQAMQVGEYALRGGIIDVFSTGMEQGYRLDLFGDVLDSIRLFDPITQKTLSKIDAFSLKPVSEYVLNDESISNFRKKYRSLMGTGATKDLLYESVSSGVKVNGLEHWLPLFFDKMATLFDYLPNQTVICFSENIQATALSRNEQIYEYYQARLSALKAKDKFEDAYYPVPPDSFFLSVDGFNQLLSKFNQNVFSSFVSEDTNDMGGRVGIRFAAERIATNVFEKLAEFIQKSVKPIVISAVSDVAINHITKGLSEYGVHLKTYSSWQEALKKTPSIVLMPLERGFSCKEFTVFSEEDILGERMVRPTRHRRAKENFIEDVSTLTVGDLVVHATHGIGRYEGLLTLQVGGTSHDCLKIVYDDDDKLFVPVENLDMLSRYGSENTAVSLDKLGGSAWQARKSRVKKQLLEMAEKLIGIAAARYGTKMPVISSDLGFYNEFCARFPYMETEDQLHSINDVISDFASGHPMDRLVCGDVGFGKTEVALRAAFMAAEAGFQVAVVVPTTLLARQHHATFVKRFAGFPLKIGRLSRLVSATEKKKTLAGLADGSIDIVVGTHALLAKSIQFKNLGLLIVDEEQHFGVAHKEQLKSLKASIHVLTLTATPIPRTLQMSLTGVRDLSVIATPPVDRLAVSTFVMPFDSVILRDAMLREHQRGGQIFYVCPRISDMFPLLEKLRKMVPELKIVAAHGQMKPTELEQIMTDFVDGKYDILLATSIIESGIDMTKVNTIIIHRADMFGLAALYQLRGRVGRSKVKAYAYLTTAENKQLTSGAQKRLEVMQSLDSLGAGFTLASHDLDIRGAGNLLGEEQSGHIKEVGIELYQKMLEDAVALLKSGQDIEHISEEVYSPQISLGLSVLIPEKYIADLSLRMELYHRMANLKNAQEIQSMRLELEDRFGPLPVEVENLLTTVSLKMLCLRAHIERVEAGTKGASISFRNNLFPNPAALVGFINTQMGLAKLKPDKLIITRTWNNSLDRLTGVKNLLEKFAQMAEE